jgi:hypothetical protein
MIEARTKKVQCNIEKMCELDHCILLCESSCSSVKNWLPVSHAIVSATLARNSGNTQHIEHGHQELSALVAANDDPVTDFAETFQLTTEINFSTFEAASTQIGSPYPRARRRPYYASQRDSA